MDERCKKLALAVEFLSQTELEEMFRMIHEHKCEYSKNNNGIFVNLAWIPNKLLEELEQYVLFCNKSGNELKKYESLCDILNKQLKLDKIENEPSNRKRQQQVKEKEKEKEKDETEDIYDKSTNKVSSSMRFTLLKKKLAKVNLQNTINENELKSDLYILV